MPPPDAFHHQVLPVLDARQDLLAVDPSGGSHEAVYATAVIDRLKRDGPAYNPTALILLPTRDFAIHVHETVFQLAERGSVARVLGLFEGKPVTSQIGPLKHGVDIVIGTPGRVLEHVKRKTLRIEQLKVLVMDRVDEMLELGQGREIEAIIGDTPKTRQTALFVSSQPKVILSMARDHLRDADLFGVDLREFEDADPVQVTDQANIHFDAGKGAGVTPRDLLGAITNEGGLDRARVGAIKIKQNFSLVAVPADELDDTVRKLRNSRIKGRKVKIRPERFRHRSR